jgi:hypothetical protein
MSKLEVDVAGVSVVKGELTTIASDASQDQADNQAPGLDAAFINRVRFTALAITMFWVTACCLYAFVFRGAAVLRCQPNRWSCTC